MLNAKKLSVILVAGLLLAGCVPSEPPADRESLAGVWALTRGNARVDVNWTVANGGQVDSDSASSDLEPLDPADFPAELAPLVEQWNNALADLNANLDAVLPETVEVSFPNTLTMTITNPDDPTKTANGFINDKNEYFFVADLAGGGQGSDLGGGIILVVGAIGGRFHADGMTTTGDLGRTLLIVLAGQPDSGVSLSVTIKMSYTGEKLQIQ